MSVNHFWQEKNGLDAAPLPYGFQSVAPPRFLLSRIGEFLQEKPIIQALVEVINLGTSEF